jgi:hypothetical protein
MDRTVLESIETVLSEAVAPQPDRVLSQCKVLRDAGVDLAVRDPQNDLRTIGILLRTGAGNQAPLEFRALSRHQPDSSSTLLGPMQRCLWSFPLHPAQVHMNSQPVSTNWTEF